MSMLPLQISQNDPAYTQRVARLAYRYWELRGCSVGSSEGFSSNKCQAPSRLPNLCDAASVITHFGTHFRWRIRRDDLMRSLKIALIR